MLVDKEIIRRIKRRSPPLISSYIHREDIGEDEQSTQCLSCRHWRNGEHCKHFQLGKSCPHYLEMPRLKGELEDIVKEAEIGGVEDE